MRARVLLRLDVDVALAASTREGAAEQLWDALTLIDARHQHAPCFPGDAPLPHLRGVAESLVDALAVAVCDLLNDPSQLKIPGVEPERDVAPGPLAVPLERGAPPGGRCPELEGRITYGRLARGREANRRGRRRGVPR